MENSLTLDYCFYHGSYSYKGITYTNCPQCSKPSELKLTNNEFNKLYSEVVQIRKLLEEIKHGK